MKLGESFLWKVFSPRRFFLYLDINQPFRNMPYVCKSWHKAINYSWFITYVLFFSFLPTIVRILHTSCNTKHMLKSDMCKDERLEEVISVSTVFFHIFTGSKLKDWSKLTFENTIFHLPAFYCCWSTFAICHSKSSCILLHPCK